MLLAPGGLRPRAAPPPHPLALFLALWLLVRLHVESGLAKQLLGDPTWRDLTAMATYYETAPLPTWIGWWAHQLPLAAHRGAALFMYLVELVLPLGLLASRRLGPAVFAGMLGMQIVIALTANYGFFNYLSAALCLFALDDEGSIDGVTWLPYELRWKPGDPSRAPAFVAPADVVTRRATGAWWTRELDGHFALR